MLPGPEIVVAQEEIRLVSASVESRFPQGILFQIEVAGPREITEITLRFHVLGERSQRYDNVDLLPAPTVRAEHLVRTDTADRYIPPGAEIEYSFEVQDTAGNKLETEPQRFTLLDPRFQWQRIPGGQATILYYGPAQELARQVLRDAEATLERVGALMGVEVQDPLRLTLYNSFRDMREALPPRSQVQESTLIVEGISFGDTGVILVLGSVLRVGGVTSHEVVHFLMRQAMGGLSRLVPAWLNEGLAEYGSTAPNPSFDFALARAVEADQLLPLTSLTAPPGRPGDVILFYGEGKSAVTFMVETYGAEPLQRLLQGLREGLTIDAALEAAYGFDRVGLETRWREAIGAPPLPEGAGVRALPTSVPLPIIIPFGVATPTPFPTATPALTDQGSGGCGRGSGTLEIALLLGAMGIIGWLRTRS